MEIEYRLKDERKKTEIRKGRWKKKTKGDEKWKKPKQMRKIKKLDGVWKGEEFFKKFLS